MEPPPENHENHEYRIEISIPSGGNPPATASSNNTPNVIQSYTWNSSSERTENRSCIQWLRSIHGSWTNIERILTLSKIVACIVVLIVARNEKPKAPLFAWVVIYAAACAAYLPVLYKYHILPHGRLFALVDNYYKPTIHIIFGLWFISCNYWVFRYLPAGAPNLHRLCIVFIIFGYTGYAAPFVGFAIVLYFVPGFLDETSTASADKIIALPTYKFKSQRNGNCNNMESNSEGEGGVVAAGTEKERVISGDDAVCCICLAKYENNDKLKELPCSHLFHSKCVNKWLKIKAFCPLCKLSVAENKDSRLSSAAQV